MESNFSFLLEKFPVLAKFGQQAEMYWQSDANSCLLKLGMIGETIVNLVYDIDKIPRPTVNDAVHRINFLAREGYITEDIASILHILRKKRNLAIHQSYESVADCQDLLPIAYTLCEWFYETYGDYRYEHHEFVSPNVMAEKQSLAQQEAERKHDEQIALQAIKSAKANHLSREKRQKRAGIAASHRHKSEAETRMEIDEQLRRVGWEADTVQLRHSKQAKPQKGHNQAIAEWPTKDGFVDYMLFCNEKMVGVIEAKAEYKDVPAVLDDQGRRYAETIKEADAPYLLASKNKYQVPFIFATNGRPYLEQYKEKSGIWFQDLRNPMNLPQALRGWMSPMGITELLKYDKSAGDANLEREPYEELKDPRGLNLRDYQVEAIRATEEALREGKKSVLLAMATGTGKTRTILGMIYRFLKTGRFHRILFLVDRTVLGNQAEDTFREVKLAELQTLTQIYNVKGLSDDASVERETSVQIATVQSLIRRVLYHEGEKMPAVTDFDLVIIDEAHRGYILDKEMSEDEILYRDQLDYMSKYRNVVEYFDAVKIALTATPALHTTQIFGHPVYTYSYRDAVVDGYLVDHDAPIHIATELSTQGIHYQKGDTVPLLDQQTGELLNGAVLPDDLDFDVEDFNKKVITESFNRAVLQEIAHDFDPTNKMQGKMLIFAVNDQHADLIVRLLREIYADIAPAEAIRKITGSIENGNQKRIQRVIRQFKNEQYPSIAVTVDLLTTGVDVPQITTLVFLRRVKSRILFEQMLGRATRLCPAIHKEAFQIYDPVGTYDALEEISNMKPVVVNPKASFKTLLAGLADESLVADKEIATQKKLQLRLENVIARMRRKLSLLNAEQAKEFAGTLHEDKQTAFASPTEFLHKIQQADDEQARKMLLDNRTAIEALDNVHQINHRTIVIDQHEDKVTQVTQGYGEGKTRPEDYLEAFTHWIQENRDKIEALQIVCTSPKELTSQELKNLRKELGKLHFSERQLSEAFAEENKEGVTADIISLIRRATMGTPLISHEARIKQAVNRLIAELRQYPEFNKMQENVLREIEKYFLADENYVIGLQMFNEDRRFRMKGGLKRHEKIFQGHLPKVIEKLNDYLYDDGGKIA